MNDNVNNVVYIIGKDNVDSIPFDESRKPIPLYEGLYDMTVSGRVYSHYRKRFLARCNDEYGFHVVSLYKNGQSKDFNLFVLWKETFENKLSEYDFKGAREVIYK
ncbi:NUMOD4 domain-containing protein [Peribacillus castrilensis]|uniref:NUMOD4 domain-containing protein n=1 Tax=Peribacillus TaxID=2675229 RepID=UPI0030F6BC9B